PGEQVLTAACVIPELVTGQVEDGVGHLLAPQQLGQNQDRQQDQGGEQPAADGDEQPGARRDLPAVARNPDEPGEREADENGADGAEAGQLLLKDGQLGGAATAGADGGAAVGLLPAARAGHERGHNSPAPGAGPSADLARPPSAGPTLAS